MPDPKTVLCDENQQNSASGSRIPFLSHESPKQQVVHREVHRQEYRSTLVMFRNRTSDPESLFFALALCEQQIILQAQSNGIYLVTDR